VKGLAEPVEVFELVAPVICGALAGRRGAGTHTVCGAAARLGALYRPWHRRRLAGLVVALVGEAAWASPLVHGCAFAPHAGLAGAGERLGSYGKANAYFPVIDFAEAYCQIDDGDEAAPCGPRFTGQVRPWTRRFRTLPALLALLDALPTTAPLGIWTRRRAASAPWRPWRRVLLRESRCKAAAPGARILHWIDSETQALLDRLIESSPTAQLCSWSTTAPIPARLGQQNVVHATAPTRLLRECRGFCRPCSGMTPGLASLTPLLMPALAANRFF